MKRYRELLATRFVKSLIVSAFPARMAYGMIGLCIFFKVERETNSVAIAGLAIGLNGITGALTAGIRGSMLDRWGQRWPLRIFVPSYALLILTLNTMHSQNLILIVAFILGMTAPPINISVRPLWIDIVPGSSLRTAYALDTVSMNTATVIGPILATSLSLSSRPEFALIVAALSMALGGGALAIHPVSNAWIPEKKDREQGNLIRNKAIQLLMLEGIFIGIGWGAFNVAIPSFATLEGVPWRTGWVLASLGIATVIGGVFGGLVSNKVSSLISWRRIYLIWAALTIPLAFTYPGWSMAILGAFIGLVSGAGQVFYFEVLEAVRPKGSQASSLGWIWTVEGTFMAFGSALGGWICQNYSPRYALGLTTLMTLVGLLVIFIGWQRFQPANKIPTVEEDLNAQLDSTSDQFRH
jgi:MFS family permease